VSIACEGTRRKTAFVMQVVEKCAQQGRVSGRAAGNRWDMLARSQGWMPIAISR
jgi:hypothetical protein